MACPHPLESLKPETASTRDGGTLRVEFSCTACLAHVTKEFIVTQPEPVRIVRPMFNQPWK